MAEQWVFGLHAVDALLKNPLREIRGLYLNEERKDKALQSIRSLAEKRNIAIKPLDLLGKRFASQNHQGAIAESLPLPEYKESDIPLLLQQCHSMPLILILDGITDVHNLGACLRSADAAGVDFVILPKDKSAPINATVSKVASGAAECVPILRASNLARCMQILQENGVWIYGAAGEAPQSLYQLNCQIPLALVMGAEDKGLRRLTREHCDQLFSLPMRGSVTSLNVSVATGIGLYEVQRGRSIKE